MIEMIYNQDKMKNGLRKMINSQDQKLLMLLRQNARASITELAKAMHVSRSTGQNRIARLEAGGVIRGYSVQLGGEFSASQVEAHVSIKVFQKLTGRTSPVPGGTERRAGRHWQPGGGGEDQLCRGP